MKKLLPAAFALLMFLTPLAWSASSGPLDIRAIRNCTAQQEDALKASESGLEARLRTVQDEISDHTLERVRTLFIEPTHRVWEAGSARNRAYENYLQQMDRVLGAMLGDTRSGLNMECKDSQRERHCQNGQVYAYVLFWFGSPQKTLYFCSSFFDLQPDQQQATLMHELSHYSASTDDLALSWLDLKNPDLAAAARDAYHLEQFASGDVAGTLKRQIWLWNWPKAGR